jgi:hypothetical protein
VTLITRVPWVQTVLVSAVAGVLITAAGSVQQVREMRFSAPPLEDARLYITSGPLVKRLTAGYNTLAADLYWIRAIQYFGGIRLKLADPSATLERGEALPTDYDQLYPLLDLTTTLDPYFNIAYRFGSIFLAEPFPSGAGRPDLAIALLEKGLRERPDRWEYMQDIGFVHYWWRHDYQAAAESFRRASQVPGAPWWLASLAAVTLAEGGDRASSRLMWETIRESAEIDWLRRDAERRLMQLQAMRLRRVGRAGDPLGLAEERGRRRPPPGPCGHAVHADRSGPRRNLTIVAAPSPARRTKTPRPAGFMTAPFEPANGRWSGSRTSHSCRTPRYAAGAGPAPRRSACSIRSSSSSRRSCSSRRGGTTVPARCSCPA